MAHLINRLELDVHCGNEEQAFNLRHNFAVGFQEQIMEAVDAVCSKYVREEEWLRIGKVEIDLGNFTPHAFDQNFVTFFKDKFEKELTQKLSHISTAQKKASRRLSRAALFQYFLQQGILPAWVEESAIDLDEISVAVLTQEPDMLRRFFFSHRSEANVWRRVALQLNREAKALVIQLIDACRSFKELLSSWLRNALLILENTATIQLEIPVERIDTIILRNAPAVIQYPEDPVVLWQIIAENIDEILPENNAVVLQIIREGKAGFPQKVKEQIRPNKTTVMLHTRDAIATVAVDMAGDYAIEDVDAAAEKDEAEKYFVKHAGIVLLTPFLKPFFTHLNLLDGLEWTSKEAQYKAIHLLKFLSTGRQRIPEYNLVLEKIICGVAIEEPIPLDVVLEEQEIRESELLLRSVIEHWKALKHTSINGLREAYLKRDGLITKKEDSWLLQVERKTLDVLTDSIPWGYSTLGFPWNRYFIFVEW